MTPDLQNRYSWYGVNNQNSRMPSSPLHISTQVIGENTHGTRQPSSERSDSTRWNVAVGNISHGLASVRNMFTSVNAIVGETWIHSRPSRRKAETC